MHNLESHGVADTGCELAPSACWLLEKDTRFCFLRPVESFLRPQYLDARELERSRWDS